jgi:hypothetical protein
LVCFKNKDITDEISSGLVREYRFGQAFDWGQSVCFVKKVTAGLV